MRKGILVIGLLFILVMGMSTVWADENAPEPGTPADNECNVGGVLYREQNQDGCPTLWYWKAGWFLARFNRGFISRADFPKEFESVLPPLQQDEPINTCWAGSIGSYSLRYIGPANALGNLVGFTSLDCTGGLVGGFDKAAVIFTSSQPSAEAICATLGIPLYPAFSLSGGGNYPSAPANAYGCEVN